VKAQGHPGACLQARALICARNRNQQRYDEVSELIAVANGLRAQHTG
jgi:hypothetical protein